MSDGKINETEPGEAEQFHVAEGGQRSGIAQFAMKAIIVGVVFSACVIFTADYIIGSVQDSFGHVGGSAFWGKVEKELDRAADPSTELPPEKKQRIIHDLRVIVARWRPLADAVQEELAKPAGTISQPVTSTLQTPHQ